MIDVRADVLPEQLRLPNATFVALIRGKDLVRVEPDGETWLRIQDAIRPVLNRHWDPIGVSDVVEDEYNIYIDELYRRLKAGSSEQSLVTRLRSIEVEEMEVRVSSDAKLRMVASALHALDLPDVELSAA